MLRGSIPWKMLMNKSTTHGVPASDWKEKCWWILQQMGLQPRLDAVGDLEVTQAKAETMARRKAGANWLGPGCPRPFTRSHRAQ